ELAALGEVGMRGPGRGDEVLAALDAPHEESQAIALGAVGATCEAGGPEVAALLVVEEVLVRLLGRRTIRLLGHLQREVRPVSPGDQGLAVAQLQRAIGAVEFQLPPNWRQAAQVDLGRPVDAPGEGAGDVSAQRTIGESLKALLEADLLHGGSLGTIEPRG